MLRLLLVFGCLGVGLWYARRGPFYVLLTYLWLAYFKPEHWVWGGGGDLLKSLRLSLAIGLILIISLLLSKERNRIRLGGSSILLLLFLAQAAVSILFSPYPSFAGASLEDLAKIIVVTCAMAGLAAEKSRFRLVLLVIGLSLAFEGAKQGWANLILNPGGKNSNLLRGFGDENGVALAMFMLTPILIVLAQTATRRWEQLLHRFLAVGVLNRGLSTYSRGGFLACGAMLLFYFTRSQRKLRTALGMVAIASVLLPVMPETFWERMATIAPAVEFATAGEDVSDEDIAGSARGRLHFWAVGAAMAEQRPLTGVGWMAYNPAYNDYDFSRGAFGENRAVHSVWFGVLGELGYPGLAIYLAIILSALWRCHRIRMLVRGAHLSTDIEQYAVCLQTGLVVFTVGATFLAYHYAEILWHFVGLTIALKTIAEQELATQQRLAAETTHSDKITPIPQSAPVIPPAHRPTTGAAAAETARVPLREIRPAPLSD